MPKMESVSVIWIGTGKQRDRTDTERASKITFCTFIVSKHLLKKSNIFNEYVWAYVLLSVDILLNTTRSGLVYVQHTFRYSLVNPLLLTSQYGKRRTYKPTSD